MPPKITGPGTGTPFTLNDDMPISSMTRSSTAMATGAPAASAMKTVRLDHSICVIDISNTRNTAFQNGGRRHDFTRYSKTACRLSSGDVIS